jgi:TolA-binding protein
MTTIKSPKEYTIDQLCAWLVAFGLSSKVKAFKEKLHRQWYACDTDTMEDLSTKLGLTRLQTRNFQQKLEFSMASRAEHFETINTLQEENEQLQKKIEELQEDTRKQQNKDVTTSAKKCH